ncbi:hypothetical protein HOI26_04890 [Candidatus Woesearchaeota archaeon]|jgi:Fe2+ or Zn2+ uptake regulation protein|nr:hypothetical protein [Candidatus Woesearchaeota archaeon]MBT5740407.1 hypothetical protein [Candidatus Woesearchaeota archaeon]
MVRLTKQKKQLNEAIMAINTFFTAQILFENVQRQVGLATIYRYLTDLEKLGKLHSFFCGGKKIYSTTAKSHVHFTCERCAEVTHITMKNADFLNNLVDHDICHFQLELVGVCQRCKKIVDEFFLK